MKPKRYPYSGKQKSSIEVTLDTEKLSNVLDKALDTSFQVQIGGSKHETKKVSV